MATKNPRCGVNSPATPTIAFPRAIRGAMVIGVAGGSSGRIALTREPSRGRIERDDTAVDDRGDHGIAVRAMPRLTTPQQMPRFWPGVANARSTCGS